MCAADADAKVQAQILGHYTQQLVKPALSQRETAVAVEAIGALAASTNRNFGEPVSPRSQSIGGLTQRHLQCQFCILSEGMQKWPDFSKMHCNPHAADDQRWPVREREALSRNLDTRSMVVMQGVRKLLEYLTPLGQKRDVTENDEQTSEASGSEVARQSAHLYHAVISSTSKDAASSAIPSCLLLWCSTVKPSRVLSSMLQEPSLLASIM